MIVSVLHHEEKLQLNDLTRIDASRSILVKGSLNPINSVKIQAGADAPEIEVFNANSKNWYLDWMFSTYAFDVMAEHAELHFKVSGVQYSTLVPDGTYTLATLLNAMKTVIEAVASPLTVTFTVDERNRINCTPSLPLEFLPTYTSKGLLPHLGFTEDGQLIGTPVEYGLRKIKIVVASISENATLYKFMKVYTAEGDALFSDDADLIVHEPDVMKWLAVGRGSYKDFHRKAQKEILDWIDRKGYRDENSKKITKWAVVDKAEVNEWSTYLALKFFCLSVRNTETDVWRKKASEYDAMALDAQKRATLHFDLNGDKKPDVVPGPEIGTGKLLFR